MEPTELTLMIIGAATLAVVLLALMMLPKRAAHVRVRMPLWAVITCASLCVGLGVGYAAAEFWGFHWWTSTNSEGRAPLPMSLTPSTPPGPPLAAGTKVPSFSKN